MKLQKIIISQNRRLLCNTPQNSLKSKTFQIPKKYKVYKGYDKVKQAPPKKNLKIENKETKIRTVIDDTVIDDTVKTTENKEDTKIRTTVDVADDALKLLTGIAIVAVWFL